MSKFNFNIDVIDNENGNLLSKSKYNSITQKQLVEIKNYIVDLGLPSGTLWCKYNLGCNYSLLINHPEDSKCEDWFGDYYAWGETKTKDEYNLNTYTFANNITTWEYELTKYNNKDKLTELQPEDDAAYQNMHIGNFKFHIPTEDQWEELIEYTENNFIRKYKNISGYELISKINENKLFIPEPGYYVDITLKGFDGTGSECQYWTSNLYSIKKHEYARYIDFNNYPYSHDYDYKDGDMRYHQRYKGLPIRPILFT